MDSERWNRIRELFEAAIDLPADERTAFLDQACGGHEDLRAEVEQLIASDAGSEASGNILDSDSAAAAGGLAGGLAGHPAEELIGAVIGSFRVERMIGHGGMGTVYAAVQDRPRRAVALKTMSTGLFSPTSRRRFEYEAEILARLSHPGIAQVYEAGTYRLRGIELPYFAMELVDGARPLDAWVREHGLGVDGILALFGGICNAVHCAHLNGVIHRDLKPANILVAADGQPKVIDFGIARDTDAGPSLPTRTGQVLGTLQYMSPEQLDPERTSIDARSDVYALGVILYELVTGKAPFDLGKLSLPAAARLVQETAVARPSSVVDGAGGRLPPDLDWIVLAATEKDRERRYGSAAELGADIARLGRDEPVLAGPPSVTYRLRKFVRRNRIAVAAALLCLLTLVGAVVATSLGLWRAVRAEELAESRRQEARIEAENLAEVNRYLVGWLSGVYHAGTGREVRLADLLDRASATLDESLQDKPHIRAVLSNAIGASYTALGLVDLAQRHLEEAVELGRAHLGDRHPDTLNAINNLGIVFQTRGDVERAEALFRETVQGRTERFGAGHELTAQAVGNLANLLRQRGDLAESARLNREALAALRAQLGDDKQQTIITMNSLADVLAQLGEFDEAEGLAKEAAELGVAHLGAEHANTLNARSTLAVIMAQAGRAEEAEQIHREVLAAYTKNFGEDHKRTLTTLANIGVLQMNRGEYAEAELSYRKILASYERQDIGDTFDSLYVRSFLCRAVRDQDRFDEADGLYRDLVARADPALTDRHWLTGWFRMGHGVCLHLMARFDEAETTLLRGLSILEATLGKDHERTRRLREELIDVYQSSGKTDDAERQRQLMR